MKYILLLITSITILQFNTAQNTFDNKVVIIDTVSVDSVYEINFPFEVGENGYTIRLHIAGHNIDSIKKNIYALFDKVPFNRDSFENRLVVLYGKFNAEIQIPHSSLKDFINPNSKAEIKNIVMERVYTDSRYGGFSIYFVPKAKMIRGFIDSDVHRRSVGQYSRTIKGGKNLYLKFITLIG